MNLFIISVFFITNFTFSDVTSLVPLSPHGFCQAPQHSCLEHSHRRSCSAVMNTHIGGPVLPAVPPAPDQVKDGAVSQLDVFGVGFEDAMTSAGGAQSAAERQGPHLREPGSAQRRRAHTETGQDGLVVS